VLATSREDCSSDLREHFTKDVSVDKKELTKFWQSTASESASRIFDEFFNLPDRTFFHSLAHTSGKTYRMLQYEMELVRNPCFQHK